MMYSQIAQLLKVLNSEVSSSQIATAVVLAMFVGLTPLASAHCLLIFLVACITRVNLSIFFLSVGLFSIISVALNSLSIAVGEYLLESPGMRGIWTTLYQLDMMRLLRFNHTLVLGGLSLAAVLCVPVFVAAKYVVEQYRERIMNWVNNLRVVKILKTTSFFQAYLKLES